MSPETTVEFDRQRDVPKLWKLAEQGIYLGTSSWKYEGWLGQVYKADYSGARKSFVKSRFEEGALREASMVFPTVCFDGGYWRLPDDKQLHKFADDLPPGYPFAIKVTDVITQRRFIAGPQKGELNPSYLDAATFTEHFLAPVRENLADKLGPIIFEFSPFHFSKPFGVKDGYSPLAFVKDLHNFFTLLPKNGLKYSVEVRDPEMIDPNFTRYLDCLEYHGVAHVLNDQTWMPEIGEQMSIPGIFPTNFAVMRALVRPGVSHEQAVKEFSPYTKTMRPAPQLRQAVAELMHDSIATRRGLYIYVNNRREGNAPNTLASVLSLFDGMQTG